MKFVEQIYYRQLQGSDFTNMYKLRVPVNGGGQTYIEAAGINENLIADFCSYGTSVPSSFDSSRLIFTIDVFAIGSNEHSDLEFAPRNNRRNYKISRQTPKDRHPAWRPENGFPTPPTDLNGHYLPDFGSIIDNLIIFIIRTVDHKYYAGFVDSKELPRDWPHGVGLEKMFDGDRRGILIYEDRSLAFVNNKRCPFDFGEFGFEVDDNGDLIDVNLASNVDVSVSSGSDLSDCTAEFIEDTINDYIDDESVSHATGYENKSDIEQSNNRAPELKENSGRSHRYKTDPRLSKTVINQAGYICQLKGKVGGDHETFDSKQGYRYVEAHHLIPMKAQKDFPNINLDRTENIVALCPTCHRAVHLGTKEEKMKHLKPLYDERMPLLQQIYPDFSLTFEDLIREYYR